MLRISAILAGALLVSFQSLAADVVVISNRTSMPADFAITSGFGLVDSRLPPTASRPFFTRGKVQITIGNSRAAIGKRFPTTVLRQNAVYRLELHEGTMRAVREELGGDEFTLKANPDSPNDANFVIPVSVWVDDDETSVRSAWEAKLKSRFAAAAKIVQAHSGVEFRIVRFGRWRSSNRVRVFSGSLYEFIDSVDPKETLAIGFSSQYSRLESGKVQRIAGTRRPLDRHILVREWTRATTEQERAELLAHELGHYLGACHTQDLTSAMRPTLADRHAMPSNSLPIQFDAPNVLVMSLIGEQLRATRKNGIPLTDLRQLSKQTKRRLRQIYSVMATDTPSDPVPTKYLMLLR